MRATYEDLLRTARRIAVSAQRGRYPDESEVMADWRAVLFATKNHLRWLRIRLRSASHESQPTERSDNALGRLAQAIGAAADLLAVQDTETAAALDVRGDLVAARAEVAAIALMAARVVLRNTRILTPERRYLRYVMQELAGIASFDVRRAGLGGLAVLAAGGPAAGAGERSLVASAAVRWERAHASARPETLLTRDLRSMTAQLRTVGGWGWHIAAHLLTASSAGLDTRQQLDLTVIRRELRSFGGSAVGVERAWRRRLSDLSGSSDSLGEVAYLDLQSAVDRVLRDERGLRAPDDLIPDHRAAVELMDAADELLWSTEQVARHQQLMVSWLVGSGRLFVPRREAARADVYFLRRPAGGSRPMQAKWVRSDIAGCFDDLTNGLDDTADHLMAASDAARRLAGTHGLPRSTAESVRRTPAPYMEDASRITDPGPELASVDR